MVSNSLFLLVLYRLQFFKGPIGNLFLFWSPRLQLPLQCQVTTSMPSWSLESLTMSFSTFSRTSIPIVETHEHVLKRTLERSCIKWACRTCWQSYSYWGSGRDTSYGFKVTISTRTWSIPCVPLVQDESGYPLDIVSCRGYSCYYRDRCDWRA